MTNRQALINARKQLNDKLVEAESKYKYYRKRSHIDEDSGSYDLMHKWSGIHDAYIISVFILDDLLKQQRRK